MMPPATAAARTLSADIRLSSRHRWERRRAQHAVRELLPDTGGDRHAAVAQAVLRSLGRRQAQDIAAAAAWHDGVSTGVRRRWLMIDTTPRDQSRSWRLVTELDTDAEDIMETVWLADTDDAQYDRAVDLSSGRVYALRVVVIREQVSLTGDRSTSVALSSPPGGHDWAAHTGPDASDYTALDAFAQYGASDA